MGFKRMLSQNVSNEVKKNVIRSKDNNVHMTALDIIRQLNDIRDKSVALTRTIDELLTNISRSDFNG